MKKPAVCNRRDFMQLAGAASLCALSGQSGWLSAAERTKKQATASFAYVGYSGKAYGDASGGRSEQGIQVFAVRRGRWVPTQTIVSDSPSFLTLHPSQRFLYAINEIDTYQGLPSGTIEAYAIDPHRGHLTLLNRQPLSLSGIMPRHMAASPDGSNLVVAVHGGGAYNVLPIGPEGHLERVSGIAKETGSGPNQEHQEASHPQMVLFDTSGRHLLGADLGSDRLSVFTLDDGKLAVRNRSAVQPGSGPRHMALHPSGHMLFVANELDASVSCFRYDAANGRILERQGHVASLSPELYRKNVGTLAIHPSGRFLYTPNRSLASGRSLADGITVWDIGTTGALTPIQSWSEGLDFLHGMVMAPDGTSLSLLDQKSGSVLRLNIDSASGQLGQPVRVAKLQAPISLAVKYL
jgi:6-phosphogluconolactonase